MDARIAIFYRQYLQQVRLEELSFPPVSVLVEPLIQFQMMRYMFTTHLLFPSDVGTGIFLPPASYQKRVLRELTRRILEAATRSPDEDVGHFCFRSGPVASISLRPCTSSAGTLLQP